MLWNGVNAQGIADRTGDLLLLYNPESKTPTRFPSYPVPVEKQLYCSFLSCLDTTSVSCSLPPFFSVCYCWICPLFRWLVAMLLSSLCSLALWWIVYGFPSSILHFCVDGLGFEWALQPTPKTPECCKWDPRRLFISQSKPGTCPESSCCCFVISNYTAGRQSRQTNLHPAV